MVEFIFTTILMVSLSGVLYLMVRALPRVEEVPSTKTNFLDRWAHSEIPEKVDAALNGFLLKFLRKIKVGVLKLDNKLAHHLQKITHEEREKEKKSDIDFVGITGELGERRMGERRKVENATNIE